MSARIKIWGACRTLVVRSRPAAPKTEPFSYMITRRRWYSTEESSNDNPATTPNKINGSKNLYFETPDALQLSPADASTKAVHEQDEESPVDRLDDAELEQIFYGGRILPLEGEGGLTEAQEDVLYNVGKIPSAAETEGLEEPGYSFPLPEKPYSPDFNHKKRYHPVLEQLTRLMMRDGKLSVAQRNMGIVMNYLRTAPAPIYSPKFPLLPGTPPAAHLPLNPVLYITIAIDSVAPLLKVKNVAGAAGGGRALEVPMPLAVRQRRRQAFKWILDVVEKKPSKGSGRKQYPQRIAEEIIAVIEGRSGVWDRRKIVHKQGTAARANAGSKTKSKRKKI